VSDNPNDAYRAAVAARAKRLSGETAAAERVKAFPMVAEEKLKECDVALQANIPAGLSLETKLGPGGLLGDRGVKSLFLILKEGEQVVAQGAITCSNDEKIALQGFPPDGDKRPEKNFGEEPFAAFTAKKAVAFLTKIIETYIV
jgi:hypothetical protein